MHYERHLLSLKKDDMSMRECLSKIKTLSDLCGAAGYAVINIEQNFVNLEWTR